VSDNKPDDADTLSALMAAAKQKADSLSAAAQTKYDEARADAANMVNAAKESFNQGMQKADQLADAAKAKFNEGVEAAQQLANDTKAKFEAGVKQAGDLAAEAKVKLESGLADAKQQGAEMMAAAKDRIQNSGVADKQLAFEVGKKGIEAGAEALGQGSSALAGGYPGLGGEIAKNVQFIQDSGGASFVKYMGERKLEEAGIRSTDETINKMAEPSKFAPDNEFNKMNKAVEQDARLGKGPDDTKAPEAAKGPGDSKFLSDSLKAKYMARAESMGQNPNEAGAKFESANPKPPENKPADTKPTVSANPSTAPSSPSAAPSSPSPSPSPKP
jgi:hypothetical protein